MYKLGTTSQKRLIGVNNKLVEVVKLAITLTETDFTVLEGLREFDRQLELWKKGASKLNGIPKGQTIDGIIGTGVGRHQTGEAVDLGAYVAGSIRWDWGLYYKIAQAMRKAAIKLGIAVRRGS